MIQGGIVLIISNQPHASGSWDFEITCMITPWIYCTPLSPITINDDDDDDDDDDDNNKYIINLMRNSTQTAVTNMTIKRMLEKQNYWAQ